LYCVHEGHFSSVNSSVLEGVNYDNQKVKQEKVF